MTGSRYLRPEDLRRFENFQFAAQVIVEGFFAGRHRSPFHDASAEFADYRPYAVGDEIRALDWRAYARTDRDYIKQFRKETDLRCHILLDCSRSMAFRDEPAPEIIAPTFRLFRRSESQNSKKPGIENSAALSKFEYGAYLAAALAYLTIRQGDKAGLALGANALQTYIAPGGTMTHLKSLLHALEIAKPDGTTNLAVTLDALFAAAPRRGLLIVISDFLMETDALMLPLARFAHRGWQVLLFHVLTETELALPGDGVTCVHDAETPEMLYADPAAVRAAYQAEIAAWLAELETQAKSRRLQYARASTLTPYDRTLERFLALRSRV